MRNWCICQHTNGRVLPQKEEKKQEEPIASLLSMQHVLFSISLTHTHKSQHTYTHACVCVQLVTLPLPFLLSTDQWLFGVNTLCSWPITWGGIRERKEKKSFSDSGRNQIPFLKSQLPEPIVPDGHIANLRTLFLSYMQSDNTVENKLCKIYILGFQPLQLQFGSLGVVCREDICSGCSFLWMLFAMFRVKLLLVGMPCISDCFFCPCSIYCSSNSAPLTGMCLKQPNTFCIWPGHCPSSAELL